MVKPLPSSAGDVEPLSFSLNFFSQQSHRVYVSRIHLKQKEK